MPWSYRLKYDDKFIGTCHTAIDSDKTAKTAEITRLYINSLHRGKGYGTKLLRYVMEDLFNNGYQFISLSDDSDRKNQENNIYHKNGFKPFKYYLRASKEEAPEVTCISKIRKEAPEVEAPEVEAPEVEAQA